MLKKLIFLQNTLIMLPKLKTLQMSLQEKLQNDILSIRYGKGMGTLIDTLYGMP